MTDKFVKQVAAHASKRGRTVLSVVPSARTLKQWDGRIDMAFNSTCKGITVRITDISKIFSKGRELIAGGADDSALRAGIRAFVETIRTDKHGDGDEAMTMEVM